MTIQALFAAAAEHAGFHVPDLPDNNDDPGAGGPADAAAAGGEGGGEERVVDPNNPDNETQDRGKPTEAEKPGVDSMKNALLDELPEGHSARKKRDDAAAEQAAAAGDKKDDGTKPPAKKDDDAAGKPAGKDGDEGKPKTEDEHKAATEAEAKSLGLKEGSPAFKRFQTLTEGLRKKDEEIEVLSVDAEIGREWQRNVEATGASPEDFGRSMAFLHGYSSNDPALWKASLDIIDGVADELRKRLGMEAKDFDPLAAHPDLADDVKKGELSRERALEIAQGRHLQSAVGTRRQQDDERTAATRAAEQAIDGVVAYTTSLSKTDATFPQKFKALEHRIREIQATRKPDQWLAEIQREFKAMDAILPPQPITAADNGQQRQTPARVGRVPGRVTGGHVQPAGDAGLKKDITDPLEGLKAGMFGALEQEKTRKGA